MTESTPSLTQTAKRGSGCSSHATTVHVRQRDCTHGLTTGAREQVARDGGQVLYVTYQHSLCDPIHADQRADTAELDKGRGPKTCYLLDRVKAATEEVR
jgi:hypothetical protein